MTVPTAARPRPSAIQQWWVLLVRAIVPTLREQDTVLPPGTERITEVVATEITRQAKPPE